MSYYTIAAIASVALAAVYILFVRKDQFTAYAEQRSMPPVTHEMKMRGTTWARTVDDGWREVCDTCGGNCGQCGMTERLGNPGFSLDRIIAKTGMNNPVNGIGSTRQS